MVTYAHPGFDPILHAHLLLPNHQSRCNPSTSSFSCCPSCCSLPLLSASHCCSCKLDNLTCAAIF